MARTVGLSVFINCFAFHPEGEELVCTASTLSHGRVDKKQGLDRVGYGIRGYRVGPEHAAACEQASPWQMGPPQYPAECCVTLREAPPPSPDEEQNSRSSCLSEPHAPTSKGVEPSPIHGVGVSIRHSYPVCCSHEGNSFLMSFIHTVMLLTESRSLLYCKMQCI